MIRRWKHPDRTAHFHGWLQGFCELADGLVTVLSLGFLASGFEMEASRRRLVAWMRRKKESQREQ